MDAKSAVLIVDDQPENIHVLLEALRHEHAVLAATDGEKALQLARKSPPPDVILLDVMMPGMDGYEVCRRLKEDEATREIPVLFVTALGEAVDEARGLALGAIDYIVKPVNPDLVRARVANHIALRQAARLKEDVERILRHDLRGALSGIIGLPRLVQREAQLSPDHGEMLQAVEQAGYRMLQMLNLGLDLYKMEQGVFNYEPQPVNLAEVLRDVAAELAQPAQSRRVPLELSLDSSPLRGGALYVLAEPLLCHCMLSNLARNALEASPSGASVCLDISAHNEQGRISVHNQGTVPESIRERFFQKYATAGKTHGTGLGAYSARLMAGTMGGDISWSSSEEQGTEIVVTLPLAEQQPANQPEGAQAEGQQQSSRSLRVLVVDDDLQAGMLVKRELQALGHEVELAAHGREALERFVPGGHHLVLMDKEMPVMDGAEACGHLRRLESDAGVEPAHLVALTGHDSQQVHQELLDAGFTRTVRKPIQPQILKDLLREAGAQEHGGEVVVCEVDADMRDMIPGLLRTLAQELAAMPDMLVKSDFEALGKQGHKRKGTCRAYGLTPLAEGFAGLEQAAKAQEPLAVERAVQHLERLLPGVRVCYRED